MKTNYTELKKEMTKAAKAAGFNSKEIKITKGIGRSCYYPDYSNDLCWYGSDVEIEINTKKATISQIGSIFSNILKEADAYMMACAGEGLREQFKTQATEIAKKIEATDVAGVVYEDNARHVAIYAHKYDGSNGTKKIKLYTQPTDLKNKILTYSARSEQEGLTSFDAIDVDDIAKKVASILADISAEVASAVDFSEWYEIDGNSQEETDAKRNLRSICADIDDATKNHATKVEEAEKAAQFLNTLKTRHEAVLQTVDTFEGRYGWEYLTLYKTQRTEFSRVHWYCLNYCGAFVEYTATGMTAEELAAEFGTNTPHRTGDLIESAAAKIVANIEEQEARLAEIREDLAWYAAQIETLNKQKEEAAAIVATFVATATAVESTTETEATEVAVVFDTIAPATIVATTTTETETKEEAATVIAAGNTNEARIAAAKAAAGISETCHTFAKWKELGYKVRKGEHACLRVELWHPNTKINKATGEEVVKMYSKSACLFGRSQVEPLDPEHDPIPATEVATEVAATVIETTTTEEPATIVAESSAIDTTPAATVIASEIAENVDKIAPETAATEVAATVVASCLNPASMYATEVAKMGENLAQLLDQIAAAPSAVSYILEPAAEKIAQYMDSHNHAELLTISDDLESYTPDPTKPTTATAVAGISGDDNATPATIVAENTTKTEQQKHSQYIGATTAKTPQDIGVNVAGTLQNLTGYQEHQPTSP